MNVKLNKSAGLPELILPDFIIEEHRDWVLAKIQSIPQQNIEMTVSEWAEEFRSIGGGLTARHGKVDFAVTPFLREIADNLSDMSPIIETYLMKGTQVGGTVMVGENHMGYCIYYGIGPLLYVGADQAMAEESMEKRVDEMIANSGLEGKIRSNIQKKKGKATGDRTDSKSYGGTFMRAVGPNSEGKLRSFPMRILILDEIDVYPLKLVRSGDDSGDPIEKAERRTDSYGSLKKIYGLSTPKQESSSRIEPRFLEGDARYYNIHCPSCKFQHPLQWKNLKWDKNEKGDPDIKREIINGDEVISNDPTYFECPECGHKIKHKDKREILQEKGHGGTAEWLPTKQSDRAFVRSYCLPAWYGFRPWMDIVQQFYRVKDDPFKFPGFVNDVMAETWKESRQKPDQNQLMQLAQEFEQWPRGHINENVLWLTVTADIQKDRIEAGLMGWGRHKQGYMIDYWVFSGDTESVENKVWKDLSDKIYATYKREDGQEMNVMMALIDRQYLTSTVDLFCDGFPYEENTIGGVFPMQSQETQDKLVKNFKSTIKTPVVGIHDQELKRGLYDILRKRPQGPGNFPGYYLHFSHEYGPEFYKQLVSEEIVKIEIKGAIKGIKILNTKQRRNEVLDVVKMAMAALQYAMDIYFDILNKSRKLQKLKHIQHDDEIFFDMVESMFHDEVDG